MIPGVDVGGGDRRIDWPGLKAAGVQFAYVKVTEGVTGKDPDAVANAAGARAAGIVVGCYHFLRALTDPIDQAEAFIARIREIGGCQLPPVTDVEWCGDDDDWKLLKIWQRRNLISVHLLHMQKSGFEPGVYAGASFTDEDLGGDFPMAASPWLWVADAAPTRVQLRQPKLPRPWQTAHIWQWGSRPAGSVGSGLDADYWMLSPEALVDAVKDVPTP